MTDGTFKNFSHLLVGSLFSYKSHLPLETLKDQRSILDFFPTSASPGFGSKDRHTEPPVWPCPLRTQGANDVTTPKGQHDPEDSPHAQCTLSRTPPTVTQNSRWSRSWTQKRYIVPFVDTILRLGPKLPRKQHINSPDTNSITQVGSVKLPVK